MVPALKVGFKHQLFFYFFQGFNIGQSGYLLGEVLFFDIIKLSPSLLGQFVSLLINLSLALFDFISFEPNLLLKLLNLGGASVLLVFHLRERKVTI